MSSTLAKIAELHERLAEAYGDDAAADVDPHLTCPEP